MKQRFVRISSVLFLVAVLAACGGTGGAMAGMDMGGSPTPSGKTGTTPGGASVQITETDFQIHSSMTTFSAGTSYHFVITNQVKTTHEFMIMPKSEGSMNGMAMGDMDSMALAHVQNIAPGQTVPLDYTFPSSARGSHPEFACYLPGHYEAGMKREVSVSV